MAKVSVGIPVFNAEAFIEDALRSIQSQTFDDLEIVVSDNCSTDRSAEIVRDLAANDRRISLHQQSENRGASFNYNNVFKLSSAPFFRWHAADDLMKPTLLESCLKEFQLHPEAVLVYPRTELIDSCGQHISYYEDNLQLIAKSPLRRACSFVRRINLCNPVFGLYRRAALLDTQLIQPFRGSDAILLLEVVLKGEVRATEEHLFQRRVHRSASLEANRTPAEIQAWFDPRVKIRRWHLPYRVRLLLEYLNAAARHSESPVNRWLTSLAIIAVWCVRRTRVTLGRVRRKLLGTQQSKETVRFPVEVSDRSEGTQHAPSASDS